jgi:hypothetical protein
METLKYKFFATNKFSLYRRKKTILLIVSKTEQNDFFHRWIRTVQDQGTRCTTRRFKANHTIGSEE